MRAQSAQRSAIKLLQKTFMKNVTERIYMHKNICLCNYEEKKIKTSELAYINTQMEELDFHGTGQYFHMVC